MMMMRNIFNAKKLKYNIQFIISYGKIIITIIIYLCIYFSNYLIIIMIIVLGRQFFNCLTVY